MGIWSDIGLLFVHRLRHVPNIKPALDQCLVLVVQTSHCKTYSMSHVQHSLATMYIRNV